MTSTLPDPQWLASLRLSAAHGDAESQYALALVYLKGNGVEPDPILARRWLRMAAQQGHEPAVSLITSIPQGHVVKSPKGEPIGPKGSITPQQ